MAQEREEDATAASALFADTQHACSHKEGARSLSPVRATCEHSSDFASDTPATRRPGLDGDKHSTSQTQQLRVMLDDPWTAWYLLGTSILAVATQICLRIVQEEGKPQSAAAAGSLNAQHSVSVAESGTQEEVVNDVKNDSPASLHACEAFDEECHARMLAFAEAASYHQNTSRFYSELKDYVLHAIFIFSLYAFSYAGLRRYQRFRRIRGSSRAAPPRRTSEEVAALLEDDAVPFALCSLAVSVALGSMLLVPLTVLDGLLRTYLSSEELYGGLASTDLSFIWQLLAVVSTACHFVLLPFAFFYTESEGLGRSAIGQRRFFSRMRETTVTLALVLALVSLLVKVLEFMQVPYMQLERLTLSYIATSMLGSLIFLILVPFGFERYITLAILALQQALAASQDKVRCDTEQEADEADDADQFESESRTWAIWRLKKMHEAEGAAGTGGRSVPPPQGGVRGETKTGGNSPAHRRAARRARQQASRLYTLGKVFGGLGLVLLSIALPATVLLRVLVFQVSGAPSQLPLSIVLSASAVPALARDTLYGCLDCVLVTYVWKATWRGLDSLPYLSTWYQKQSARVLTVRELCLHCLVYLAVGTSFPVITCTLGLTKIQHVYEVSATAVFQHRKTRWSFNFLFMAVSTLALGVAVKRHLHRMRDTRRTLQERHRTYRFIDRALASVLRPVRVIGARCALRLLTKPPAQPVRVCKCDSKPSEQAATQAPAQPREGIVLGRGGQGTE